jgi:hypothetical protein
MYPQTGHPELESEDLAACQRSVQVAVPNETMAQNIRVALCVWSYVLLLRSFAVFASLTAAMSEPLWELARISRFLWCIPYFTIRFLWTVAMLFLDMV